MKNQLLQLFTLYLCIALIGASCSKKVTKVTSEPQPQPTIEITAPVLTDENGFRPVDMDAKMKELFVPIYFDYNLSGIRSSEINKLEKIASFLNDNSRIRILIEGHCDERGSNEYNLGLGEKRAHAVQTYLSGYGIPFNRIEVTTYGKERPAVPGCDNEDCFSQNRRGEWKILNN